jgi:hypothetical protein
MEKSAEDARLRRIFIGSSALLRLGGRMAGASEILQQPLILMSMQN